MPGKPWIVACAVLCLAAAALGCPAWAAPRAGEPAPALAVTQTDGKTFDLAARRGRVVIVNFWATWCPPCREEMPALDAFYRQYHERGVDLIGISVEKSRSRDAVKKMMERFQYPAALIGDARPNGFGNPAVLPMTYIVDAAGTVRAVMRPDVTPVTAESLAAAVLPLLPAAH